MAWRRAIVFASSTAKYLEVITMVKGLGILLIVAGVTSIAVAVRKIQEITRKALKDDVAEPVQAADNDAQVEIAKAEAPRNARRFGNVDAYLAHQMEGSEKPNQQYPFLMRVREQFDEKEIPGLSVSSKIGDIWACRATVEAIDLLATDARVLCIEGSPRGHLE